MARINPEEGRYRVLLIGIGANTEEDKGSFCRNLSKSYHIPFPLIRKIVDSSPIIVKKNIPFKKAETLARTLKSFGATVSLEERKTVPLLTLEFQELTPHQLALQSSCLKKGEREAWSLTGRVKNLSDETLTDVWVLVQLFQDLDEFVAFEENPLSINPLPSGEASPFKIFFGGDVGIKRISIAFKHASGHPIAATDQRKIREWVEVPIEVERLLSSSDMPSRSEKGARVVRLAKPSEKEVAVPMLPPTLEPLEKVFESSLTALEEDGHPEVEESKESLGSEISPRSDAVGPNEMDKGDEAALVRVTLPPEENEKEKEEAPPMNMARDPFRLPEGVSESSPPPFAWIESFRTAVEAFHKQSHDDFTVWFEDLQKRGEFTNSVHCLFTLLAHSRFEQGRPSAEAFENTKRVFGLLTQANLPRDKVPALEGTPFASPEVWTDLFHRALPKMEQIGKAILQKAKWSATDLERLVQVIPHMGPSSSRRAVHWINELIRDVVEVDFTGTSLSVDKGLYRVASRLGVADPRLDPYEGTDSRADAKIQSFAGAAFPDHPGKIREPMTCMGRREEQGGHCFPIQPWCEGCLFGTFCPKLCVDFDPSATFFSEDL